ncbi:MAG: hypothetical protein ACHQM4_07305 [Thermoanaerobaculia bacterium]
MSRSIRRRLLAAWALTLCPTARAGEIRFAKEFSAADAARWESRVREDWSSWERRFGMRVARDELAVSLADASAMPSDFGRSRNGRIELNRLLTKAAAEEVFRHELAHVFFESRCASLAKSAPMLSEAFALFVSGDAARRAFEGTRFLYASTARDWLLAHAGDMPDARADSRAAQQALARVLALPGKTRTWDAYFAGLLTPCGEESFAASGAMAGFFDAVRGPESGEPAAPSRVDFLLVDGLAAERLADDGRFRARFPVASILKPSLVAAMPALMERRAARDTPEWRCPARPKPGEIFTWQRALTASCNGFFLDFAAASPDGFEPWEDEMRRLGLELPDRPTTMEERIGLKDGITLSPLEAVRVFCWLDRKAPFVVDALRGTPRHGTLARAPDAGWFAERRIALKTGSVRDLASEPLHAWIVAVGPRDASGAPAFVAALHATGRATATLLPELRRRLVAALSGLERAAEVQILGLVPEAGVGLACDGGAPLLVRARGGEWRLEKPGTALAPGTLVSGASYACPGAALAVTFADGRGATTRRLYSGALRVEESLPAGAPSSVPLRERSARARRGSRFVLTTSERAYVTSSLLSELPEGHTELLAALSLVVRNNRLARRHGDRPPCDTTHCNLFGQDAMASREARARAREAVAAVARLEIAASEGGRRWLPFSLGGPAEWTEARTGAAVAEALGLDRQPARFVRAPDGGYEIAALRLSCEVLRNQLRLPSCPSDVVATDAGFTFRGRGEGHGAGLDLTAASAAAAEGADFSALLARAWPDVRVVPSPPPAALQLP